MTTKDLCKNLIGSFESCVRCQHDSEMECEHFELQTFSFGVECNSIGKREIIRELRKFLDSKNWVSTLIIVDKSKKYLFKNKF